MAIAFMAMATSLTGCENGDAPAERPAMPETETVAPAATAVSSAEPALPVARASVAPAAADAGVPAFAAVYPGAQVSGPPTVADSPDGRGGIVSFTTDADPDTVVAYYRQQAEAAGLSSIMGMNQGKARAYGAVAADDAETSLRVVADPVDGATSVQLTWSTGR